MCVYSTRYQEKPHKVANISYGHYNNIKYTLNIIVLHRVRYFGIHTYIIHIEKTKNSQIGESFVSISSRRRRRRRRHRVVCLYVLSAHSFISTVLLLLLHVSFKFASFLFLLVFSYGFVVVLAFGLLNGAK